MATNNTTYIINTAELPKTAAGAAFIPNGLEPALVSGAPGTATAGQWADGPMGNFPAVGGTLMSSFPDRPNAERTACNTGAPIIDSVSPASVVHATGAVVTITGSRLTGATAVAIGGAATAIVVVNDRTLRCATPAASVAGAVASTTVTTPAGTSPGYAGFSYT